MTTATENLALRRAMAEARVRNADVARALAVDPKTVQRWLSGRQPQPRHREALAELLGRQEQDLWPQLVGIPAIGAEIRATYAHRAAVPRHVWQELFARSHNEIGILVYSGLFLAEDIDLQRIIEQRARAGVRVRLLLGDPDADPIAQRGADEGIAGAMPAKVRNAVVLFASLLEVPGIEARVHGSVLYNSIYFADDEMLVNPHVYGVAAAHAPVLHLRSTGEGHLVDTYRLSFERVWELARPLEPRSAPPARTALRP